VQGRTFDSKVVQLVEIVVEAGMSKSKGATIMKSGYLFVYCCVVHIYEPHYFSVTPSGLWAGLYLSYNHVIPSVLKPWKGDMIIKLEDKNTIRIFVPIPKGW